MNLTHIGQCAQALRDALYNKNFASQTFVDTIFKVVAVPMLGGMNAHASSEAIHGHLFERFAAARRESSKHIDEIFPQGKKNWEPA